MRKNEMRCCWKQTTVISPTINTYTIIENNTGDTSMINIFFLLSVDSETVTNDQLKLAQENNLNFFYNFD